jgi:hypothetical protein
MPTNYLRLELFDSAGTPVPKTPKGRQYSALLDEQQLKELFETLDRRQRVRALGWIGASSTVQFARFYLTDLFEITAPGQYVLKVQMRLVRNTGAPRDTDFKTQWLDTVTARISVRAADGG